MANGGKYTCLICYYMFLSLARIDHSSTTFHVLFILFAGVNAVYSSIWDIFMDFSLGQLDSKNVFLRNELAFHSKWPYYTIIVVDPILRCNWVLYAVFWTQIEQSAKFSFIVSLIEILRRFLWIFFRVENEHCTNVARYRASRDLTLPYDAVKRNSIPRREEAPESEEAVSTSVGPSHTEAVTYVAPRRKYTFSAAATPVIAAVALAMKSAHAADFERRRPDVETDQVEDDDDDEEEFLKDDDTSVVNREFTGGKPSDGDKDLA